MSNQAKTGEKRKQRPFEDVPTTNSFSALKMFKLSKSASSSPAPSTSDNEYNDNSDYNDDNYSVFKPNKTTDNSNSQSRLEDNSKSNKKHQKDILEKRFDKNVISTFTPNNSNVFYSNKKNSNLSIIGLKKGEKICFKGVVAVACIYGSFSIYGHVVSSNSSISQLFNKNITQENFENTLKSCINNIAFYPAFSPKSHGLLVIESLHNSLKTFLPPKVPEFTEQEDTKELETELYDLIKSVRLSYDRFDTLVVLKTMEWCNISDIEKQMPSFKYLFNMNKKDFTEDMDQIIKYNINPCFGIREFYPLYKTYIGHTALKIPPSWFEGVHQFKRNILSNDLNSLPVVAITGSKNMGKSTFSRYIVNSLLNCCNEVAYLECDIGQSEFTPSGMISLHIISSPILGPSFTHIQQPYRSFYIGASTPKQNPEYYLNCINELYKTYMMEVAHKSNTFTPLIINTHGWTRGIGFDLLIQILRNIKPMYIYQFAFPENSSNAGKNLPDLSEIVNGDNNSPYLCRSIVIYTIDEINIRQKYNPIENRTLNLLSYFSRDNNELNEIHSISSIRRGWWNFREAFSEKIPYQVFWRDVNIQILYADVPNSQILYALNGSIVGLISDTTQYSRIGVNNNQNQPVSEKALEPYLQLKIISSEQYMIDPSRQQCVGIGIIRSIDPSSGKFYIITPVSQDALSRVNLIIRGANYDLPSCIYMSGFETSKDELPYCTFTLAEGIGSVEKRIRHTLQRKKSMTNTD
ncbi:hypothetical protein BCR36DRAFT_353398 [Piromyces finnis]|uniref:Polynucleotide 5'-hydroxyl-kinase GRC3 n=1 Tax=Piromyces finnis TaxID=1754191 RepID=A0A1Y1V8G7_9FUNG|nr:hypothetical protein BCR36DRAFT_353398 [Piromyces finnis]|eukprot:ORX49701.1 hypothetical protein BCR36DRAFT_353398 [Piromyces finnis]